MLLPFAVASEEGIAVEKIIMASSHLGVFRGDFSITERFLLITAIYVDDDYGHHPNEVRSVIAAIRNGWPGSRLIMVYQPHRYSRTLKCLRASWTFF